MTLRRPGGRWRLLAHEWTGRQDNGCTYGTSHHVTNDPAAAERNGAAAARLGRPDLSVTHAVPATAEFDELVVGSWLHCEQVDAGTWWLDIGGLVVHVTADRDGRPKRVTWELDERDGVSYEDRTG